MREREEQPQVRRIGKINCIYDTTNEPSPLLSCLLVVWEVVLSSSRPEPHCQDSENLCSFAWTICGCPLRPVLACGTV